MTRPPSHSSETAGKSLNSGLSARASVPSQGATLSRGGDLAPSEPVSTAVLDPSLPTLPLCFYFRQVIQSHGLDEGEVLTAGYSKYEVQVPKNLAPGLL